MNEKELSTIKIVGPQEAEKEQKQEPVAWFVIRVTYGRERKLHKELEERKIDHFLPEKTVTYNRPSDGKIVHRKKSAIPNMIFIHDTRSNIQALKTELEGRLPMRYMMNKTTHQPVTVRDRQMQDFIRLVGSEGEKLLYLDNPDVVYEKGQPVEVIFGPFAGIQGYILRIRRDRKLVICLDGVLAAAVTAEIHSDWIRKIE